MPLSASDYLGFDATGLLEAIDAGEIQPGEAVAAALSRLEAVNPRLGLLAHRLDRPGKRTGPLAGIPFLLKDELELEGAPMTVGCRLLEGRMSTETHPFIERLLGAGLHVIGRTAMSELGLLPTTEPPTGPPCKNPWRLGHSPGGSSGGSAAAVAAGVVPMAHAADGGGSIRIPASACGLVGLKPSRGRYPSAPSDPPFGFVTHHVLTRTVRDSAAFLDAVCGSTPGRYWVPPPEGRFSDAVKRPPGELRIAYTLRSPFGDRPHPDVEAALLESARRLEALGHRLEEVGAPVNGEEMARAFGVLWAAAGGVLLRLLARALEQAGPNPLVKAMLGRRKLLRRLLAVPDRKGPRLQKFTRFLARRDEDLSPSALWLAHVVFGEMEATLAKFFVGFDLWLTPTLLRPPDRIGSLFTELEPVMKRRSQTRLAAGLPTSPSDLGLARVLLAYVGFTPLANGVGLPAISVPMGVSAEGLPMGLHLLAPLGAEDRLLSVAGQWEATHPWPRLAPFP